MEGPCLEDQLARLRLAQVQLLERYMMDNVMERSWLAGRVACGIEHPEAVSVQVRVNVIE
jgi:hypothetical protein